MKTQTPVAGVGYLWSLLTSAAAERRFPFAVRAGLCCAIPVLVGWFYGDIGSGLLATIGSFTALYGSTRPYRNRAIHLATIAVILAAVVAAGILIAPYTWLAIAMVALTAALATFACNTLRVGPPGAYMFALACASGTGMAASGADPLKSGLCVLGGGILSWLAHMVGAFFDRRGPERAAVQQAAQAVADFAQSVAAGGDNSPGYSAARHKAASALDNAWMTLVSWQPADGGKDETIRLLRSCIQRLHQIFASGGAAVHGAREAQEIAQALKTRTLTAIKPLPVTITLERISVSAALQEGLSLWSAPLLLAIRVAVATAIAGGLGVALGLDRAYWGMAAVVVVLNQTYGWAGTSRRAFHRVFGTLSGLILAWLILALHPQGVWIALVVGLLQFCIEIWVVLQYAVAAVFITSNALTIAAGGKGFPEITHLFTARALDTAIGCAVALAVFILTVPRSASLQIFSEIRHSLSAARQLLMAGTQGTTATPQLLRARRRVHQQAIILQQVFNAEFPALKPPPVAQSVQPVVEATQSLSYRLLSACWGSGDISAIPVGLRQQTVAQLATLEENLRGQARRFTAAQAAQLMAGLAAIEAALAQ